MATDSDVVLAATAPSSTLNSKPPSASDPPVGIVSRHNSETRHRAKQLQRQPIGEIDTHIETPPHALANPGDRSQT
jgi:hypothetical protein